MPLTTRRIGVFVAAAIALVAALSAVAVTADLLRGVLPTVDRRVVAGRQRTETEDERAPRSPELRAPLP
jgi:hypothetical protein